MKINVVAGARPNFMKVAPIISELEKRKIAHTFIHTGQHYDYLMSEVFFADLGLRTPDVSLEVGSGTHAKQTAAVMHKYDDFLDNEPRGAVTLVVGDVNSSLACALVAAKREFPVVHVEAGLRSFDRTMPEEFNRILVDELSDLFFTPSPDADENLLREGRDKNRIRCVGNVMIDSLIRILEVNAQRKSAGYRPKTTSFAVVTAHRPSNVDTPEGLKRLLQVLSETTSRFPIVFPIHPRARGNFEKFGLYHQLTQLDGVEVIDPLGYAEFIDLLKDAQIILTDSGGIQEEASYLKIPCLTMRDNTERPATITSGSNRLVGWDMDKMRKHLAEVANGTYEIRAVPSIWDGKSSIRIVDALEERYSN